MTEKTWPNNLEDYVNTDGNNGVADWDPSLCRFIFIDGDLGDDSHAGYLDAAPGTTFSPVDTAAVAIRTTRRLDQIRPAIGAGRMLVTLWKPREHNAPYDYAAPGDGEGTSDRARLSGYSLIHDRGSDHTNSPTDKVQLGFVPASPAFDVSAVNVLPIGTEIVLGAPAVFADPENDVMPYRIRISRGGNVIGYAAPRWGDGTGAGRTNVILIRTSTVDIHPADSVVLERPGVTLPAFAECQATSIFNAMSPDLLAAGLTFGVAGGSGKRTTMGSNLTNPAPLYAGVRAMDTPNVILAGAATFAAVYGDEAQSIYTGCSPVVASLTRTSDFRVGKLACDIAVIRGALLTNCESVALHNSHFFGGLLTGSVGIVDLDGVDFADVSVLDLAGSLNCRNITRIPTATGALTIATSSSDGRNLVVNINAGGDMWARPDDVAGLRLARGEYTVALNVDQVQLGSRVDLGYGADLDTESIPLRWSSLRLTGFEYVGGQKVVCFSPASTGYIDGRLPCPRAFLCQYEGSEGGNPNTIPPGHVVVTDSIGGTAIRLASTVTHETDLGEGIKVAGVLVTNCDSPDNSTGGHCLVASTGDVAVRLTPQEPYPAPGAVVYASAAVTDVVISGYVTATPPPRAFPTNGSGPVIIGRIAPIGYDLTRTYAVATLAPRIPTHQVSRATGYAKADTVLGEVLGLSAYVRSGQTYSYRLSARITANAAAGAKFSFDSPDYATFAGAMWFHHRLTADTPALALSQSSTALGNAGAVGGGVGVVAGVWESFGTFTVNSGGTIMVYFAQSVGNAAPSTIVDAVFEVVEQG